MTFVPTDESHHDEQVRIIALRAAVRFHEEQRVTRAAVLYTSDVFVHYIKTGEKNG